MAYVHTTQKDQEKLDTFNRKCLKRILKIHWPDKILVSNQLSFDSTLTIPIL